MHVLNPWSFLPENKCSFLGNFPQVFPPIFRSFSSTLVMNVDILNRHSDFLVFSFLLPISLFSFLYFLGKESTYIFWSYYYYSGLSCGSIKLSPNQTKPQISIDKSSISNLFEDINDGLLILSSIHLLVFPRCFFLCQFLHFILLS